MPRIPLLIVLLVLPLEAVYADSLWNDMDSYQIFSDSGEAEEAADTLKGSVQFGYLASSGNSDTTSMNGKFNVEYDMERWRHGFMAEMVRASEDGTMTAERYSASAKSDLKFSHNNYMFGLVNYEQDRFAGYIRRTSEAIGYGRRLLDSKAQKLDLEAGLGARQTAFNDHTSSGEIIERLAGSYVLNFSDTSSFNQTVAYEHGDKNSYTESVSSVTAQLMDAIALKVSYTIKHNSTVPDDLKKTDTFTSVSLLYSF